MLLQRFKPYFAYLKTVRVKFAIGLLAGAVAASASGAGLPFVIKVLVPLVTEPNAPEGWMLLGILLSIPAVFLLRAGGSFLNAYYMSYCGMHVLEQIRLKVFAHLQQLPLAFFQQNQTGDLMSRVSGDTAQLQSAIIRSVNSLIKEPITLLSAIGFLIYISFESQQAIFMLIALASVPCCVLPIRWIGKKILKKATLAQQEAGRVNSVLNENLGAAREVRAYNLESRENERFADACRAFFRFQMKTVKYDKALTPIIEVVTATVIPLAIYTAVVKEVQPEVIASILTALYMCYEPVKKLGAVSNVLRRAEASLNRLEYILHTRDSVPEPTEPRELATRRGEINFEQVAFAYDPKIPVLQEINVHIPSGQSVALVGPSGAGKSTFANLVPRFYDATSGRITLDGIDVRELRKRDLRAQVALVSQEAILFDDSIANNIRLSKPDATDAEVEAAARQAQADRFIHELEGGYSAQVGERGSRLSGGQRQRISIARAFLKDAPVIILDEPTSALDAESEHHIQIALAALAKGRTVLTIAHRFSTIQHADRIFVFEAGRIIAAGTHSELIAGCALYKSLFDKQSKTAQDHA
ncbi:MAG: ABC transporter ATP-binding protein [Opitutales bacterium]